MSSYYINQLKALIKRNILLKKKQKMALALEIYFPILLAFMAFTNLIDNKMKNYNEIGPTPLENLETPLFRPNALGNEQNVGFVLPKNSENDKFINTIMENEVFSMAKPIQFKNEKEMDDYVKDYQHSLIAGIVFESDDYLQYTIRVNGTFVPDPTTDPIMNYAYGRYQIESQNLQADSYMNAFAPVQAAVDQAIIRLKTNDDSFSMIHQVGALGKPPSKFSTVSNLGKNNLSYDIGAMFVISMITIVTSLVQEKENKIKEGLLMAGVHPTVFWLSWLWIYIICILIISILVAIVFHIAHAFGSLNPFIMFFAIFFYGLSCCTMSFLFSTLFKRVKTAGTIFSIFIMVLVMCNFCISYINMTILKIFSFIFSPISIGAFVQEVFNMKLKNIDMSFKSIIKSDACIIFIGLIFTNILYFVLAVIFDNLFSESGNYLFKKNIKVNDIHDENDVSYERDIQEDYNAKNNETCVVEVSRVHKVFNRKTNDDDDDNKEKGNKKNEFLAVDDVSFKVYQNEIFAILGHNGAGKTTLINIMVGILKASYGDVFFDGKSVSSNINEIRKDYGVCAQQNIIYDDLTVEEHIIFYGNLKNITVNVDEMLTDLDLLQQKEVKAKNLSGGQKRKLCIGMALVGNPKYIFLDEPTTGLDPLSRRKIWELLLKKKEGRVIFLTTHYMDEADILADRKLILSKGKIRCLGTSLYLKNHFNMSYNLDIETNNKDGINQIIKSYLPEAVYYENSEDRLVNNESNCHTWKLPLNSTSNFSSLLNELDNQKNNNVIEKYALTMPSLEELFIRLEDDTIDDINNNDAYNPNSEEQHLIQTETELPKLKSISKPSRMSQLICLIKYRLKIFLKDKAFAINSILYPIITAALSFYLVNKFLNGANVTSNSKVISVPTMYSDTIVNYDADSTLNFTSESLISAIGSDKGLKSSGLKEITYPKANENYYLSSIKGDVVNNTNVFQVYYNDTMTHSIPASFNVISNAILASNNVKEQIITKSHPFVGNSNNMILLVGLTLAGMMIGMCLITPLSKFAPLITHERVDQLLQQLQLNGVSRFNYWISCFLSDNLIFLFTCILILISGIIVRFDPLLDVTSLIVVFVSLIIWSIPTLLYQYILSFFFKNEETALTQTNLINTYSTLFGFLIFTLIDSMGKSKIENLIVNGGIYGMASILFNIILTIIVPSYGLIAILNALFNLRLYSKLLNYDFTFKSIIAFNNGISPIIIVLLVLSVVNFFFLVSLDKKKNQTNKNDIWEMRESEKTAYEYELQQGDDDVYNEFEYVKQNQKELPISVLHLSKEYPVSVEDKEKKKIYGRRKKESCTYGQICRSNYNVDFVKNAVVDVTFGVRNHECFGLLGPNGAGKSTTLNTITSTIPQTTGTICFNGIETHLARLGEISMGYCPQKDILWKELTLREHIEFFLNIRGYTAEEAKEYATQYINVAGLEEHQNKRTEKLSGGTKRKLSLIIAICNYPKQILLDEPTAGMDPSTRRLIWNIIKKTKSVNDSALILTTHSMEEAEYLCDRLAILVNGRLVCIGSPEHLKMKHGDSYVLELQSENVDQFHKDMVESGKLFGDKEYNMERSSENRVKYEVKITHNFGSIFNMMEQCKSTGLVQDYSFSQTSLEQVFINFAKQQVIEPDN